MNPLRCACILVTMILACATLGNADESAKSEKDKIWEGWREADLRLGAHRGGRNLWPEDTLFAYQHAIEKWPSVLLEGDVHITADKEVVIMHDSTVDRTTNGKGPISEKTLAELKALDAAYHFTADSGKTFPYRGTGITVSTLEEVLIAIPDHRFQIEIKSGDNAAELTVNAIRKANAIDRVLLASVNPLYMNQVRTLAPEIATCFDYANAMKMITIMRKGDWTNYQPTDLMLAVDPRLLQQISTTPQEIQAIRAKGVLYQVFTLNNEEPMRENLKIGLDSILTDEPELLQRVLKDFPK